MRFAWNERGLVGRRPIGEGGYRPSTHRSGGVDRQFVNVGVGVERSTPIVRMHCHAHAVHQVSNRRGDGPRVARVGAAVYRCVPQFEVLGPGRARPGGEVEHSAKAAQHGEGTIILPNPGCDDAAAPRNPDAFHTAHHMTAGVDPNSSSRLAKLLLNTCWRNPMGMVRTIRRCYMPEPLALPTPSDERLAQSPLKLVVCQVRHNQNIAVSDPGQAIAIHRRFEDRYPEINSFEQGEVVFTAGPGVANANTAKPQHGWQFKSDDELWTVTLQTSYFSLETSSYADWDDFRERFEEVLEAVVEQYSPKLEQRVGLRYLDEIERRSAKHPSDWAGLIQPGVLGPLGDLELGPSVRAAQQVIEFEGPEQTRVMLRHGCEPLASGDGTVYRLDHV